MTGATYVVTLRQGTASVAAFLDLWLAATPGWQDPAVSSGGVWAGYFELLPITTTEYVFSASLMFNGSVVNANASVAAFTAAVLADPVNYAVVNASLAPYSTSGMTQLTRPSRAIKRVRSKRWAHASSPSPPARTPRAA